MLKWRGTMSHESEQQLVQREWVYTDIGGISERYGENNGNIVEPWKQK